MFRYTAIGKNGKKISTTIEAHSLEDAKSKLKAQRIMYTAIEAQGSSWLEALRSSKKISAKDLANLSRDLAIYIQSGISIVGAIKLAKTQFENDKRMNAFLSALATHLDEGKNFFQALDLQTVIDLPAFYKQSIKVSEDSGIMDKVLLDLATFLKEQDRITKQIQTSFAYPGFIIIVSVFMVGFMLSFVVPKISQMFEQMNQQLPPITVFIIWLGDFVGSYWLFMLLAAVAALGTFAQAMRTNAAFKFRVDRMMLKLPLVGKISETSELARFAYISSVLLRSGVPFVQTVNLAAKILKNSVLSRMFEEASIKVVEGGKLSVALAKSDYPLDKAFIQAITLGEETSEVVQVLENLSRLYLENNKDKITVFLSLLEPVLMLLVGGIIGTIITSMLLPIFSMNIG